MAEHDLRACRYTPVPRLRGTRVTLGRHPAAFSSAPMAVRLTLRDETGVAATVVSAGDDEKTLLVSTLALLVTGALGLTVERHSDGGEHEYATGARPG